jgi:uncharacterized protein involved in exopolysaccharide biosynthesis
MRERFQNILNMGKKRRGVVALCVVLVVVCTVAVLWPVNKTAQKIPH